MKKKTKSLIVSFALAFTLLFSAPVGFASFKTDNADAADATQITADSLTADKVFGYDSGVRSDYKVIPADNNLGTAYDTPDKFVSAFKGNSIYVPLAKSGGDATDGATSAKYAQSMTFDISDNTKDDVLLEWKPAGAIDDGAGALRTYKVSIIGTDNRIDIFFVNPKDTSYGYITTSPGDYTHGDSTALYVTANGLSDKGGYFDDNWGIARTVAMTSGGNQGGVDATSTQKIYYDATEKAIYADVLVWDATGNVVKTEKKLVRDLDATDATNGNESSAWSGFSSGNVYIEISHESGTGARNGYGFLVREIDGIKMACDDEGYILDSYQVKEGGVVSGSAYNKPADVNVTEGSSETLSLPTRKDGNATRTEGLTVSAVDADGNDVTESVITGLGTENAYAENATITPTRGTTVVTFTNGSESVKQKFIVDGLKQYKLSAKVGENESSSTVTVNGAEPSTTEYADLAETGTVISIVEDGEEKLTSIKVGGVEKIDSVVNGTLTLNYADLKYKTDIELTFSDVWKMTLKSGEDTLGVITAAKGNKFSETDAYEIVHKKGYTHKINNSENAEYDFDATTPDANVEVRVVYTAIEYTLKVNGADGIDYTSTLPKNVTVETDLTLPSLTKNGYSFIGWYTDASYVHPLSSGVLANAWQLVNGENTVNIYARLTADVYSIEYVTNGGTLSGDYAYDYTIESTPTLPTATKKGYSFDGWYDGEDKVDDSYVWGLENKSFTARYNLTTYTVTFKNDGADAGTGIYTIDGTTALSFPTDVTKGHYTLKGWGYNGEIYTAASFDYDIAEDITLIAEWEATKYSVTYESVDGAVWGEGAHTEYITIADKPAESGKLALTFSAISKAGYTFGGWTVLNGSNYDAITENEIEFKDEYLADGGLTLKPVWNAITYNVTLNVMGGQLGTETYTTSFTVEDTTIALPSASIAGLEFMGWYTSMNGFEADKVEAGAFTFPASDLTLYAKYDSANVDITYMVDGEIFEKVNVVKYGTVQKLTKTPVKAGYSFIGWYNGDSAYTFGALATDDVTLTAKFEALEYTIVLEGNGAELSNTTVTFSLETTQLTLPTPEREGYTFDGWYLDGQKIDASTFNATIGNKKLEARWIENATGETTAESCGTEAVGLLAVVLSALAAALVIKRK